MDTHHRKSSRSTSYRLPLVLAFLFILALIFVTNSHAPSSVKKYLPTLKPLDCPVCERNETNRTSTVSPFELAQSSTSAEWAFDTKRDASNYGLSLEQCSTAFPGLFVEIDNRVNARKTRHITEAELATKADWQWGMIRCMIYDGQLYVLETNHADMRRSRQFSTMLAISRALVGASNIEKIPNVEFVIGVEDWTIDEHLPIWAYDRQAHQNETWLMPDFGYWGWPEPGVGSYAEVRKKMEDVESEYPGFAQKRPSLFWRGAIVPAVAPVLRQHLVEEVQGKSWADVEVLVWSETDEDKRHRVPIEDHCRFQYLANTEGRAWSGRLKYIQNCHSVIVAHKFDWIVPHEYLMVSEGPEQNYISVEQDFSDLSPKMEHFLAHPEEAERIANNSARIFRDRYLTPAAEACYWRKLIHGWAQVSFEPRFYDGEGPGRKWRGVPFDSYVLMRELHWEPT